MINYVVCLIPIIFPDFLSFNQNGYMLKMNAWVL